MGEEKFRYEILERAAVARLGDKESAVTAQKIDQNILRQLENAVSDLRRAEQNTFGRHVKKLSRLLHSDGLETITRKLIQNVDLDAWLEAGNATAGSFVGSAQLDWPSDTEDELGTVVLLIDRFAEDPDKAINFSFTFYYNGNNITSNQQNMVAQMIVPFIRDYIDYVKSTTGTTEPTLLPARSGPAARKVFIVHGRDEGAREAVARFLEKLQFEAIIMNKQTREERS